MAGQPVMSVAVMEAVRRLGPTATNEEIGIDLKIRRKDANSLVSRCVRRGWLKRSGYRWTRRLTVTRAGAAVIRNLPSDSKPKVAKPVLKYTGTPKRRACLMCREMFDSGGDGNRICHDCKATQAWKSGENVTHSLGGTP